MWNLPLERIEKYLHPLPRLAIETGTCRGHATRALARRFARVITIELDEKLHRETAAKLRAEPGLAHVECLQGNSAAWLQSILPSIKEPVFFFLDAHWSGDASVDWANARWKGYGVDTAHLGTGRSPTGPEQCPLAEELRAIVRYCQEPTGILIDDLKNLPLGGMGRRDHEFPGEDWSHLSRELLLSIAKPRLRQARELAEPAQWLLQLSHLSGALTGT